MSESCDVLIIGAGIHGAGVAQAAAAAGYSVRVLERHGIAHGTSSRSSKLIHGGLRYLEQMELGLVRECLRERELLLRLAPELVRLVPFRIPVYRETRRRPWQLRAGLTLYALLTGFTSHARFQSLPRRRWDGLDGLKTEGLQAVLQYWDGQTDDAALTRAVLCSAEDLGATLHLPATLDSAVLDETGAEVEYTESGRRQRCRCRVLVNAAGPWVSEVVEKIAGLTAHTGMDLVQGTHLLLDLPARDSIYYMEVPEDGRAVFLMPWQGKSLLGTTETLYHGAPGSVAPQPAEREYLKRVLVHYFPGAAARELGSFAGLRVLPRDETRPFERGRELIYAVDRGSKPRVLSLYGGKLTSYRADAEKALARIRASLPARARKADTARLPLKPVD